LKSAILREVTRLGEFSPLAHPSLSRAVSQSHSRLTDGRCACASKAAIADIVVPVRS